MEAFKSNWQPQVEGTEDAYTITVADGELKMTKKKVIRILNTPEVDKEEEFFRMLLLTFQMKYRENKRVLRLDHRTMYK